MLQLLLRVLALSCVALLPMAFSAWVDPARIRGRDADDRAAAAALVSGHMITDAMNRDDRNLERWLAALRTERPTVLAMGSSRLWTLGSDAFNGQRVANVSVANARMDDFLGLYGLYDAPARRPSQLVLSLDPWSVTPLRDEGYWHSLAGERAAMLERLGVSNSLRLDQARLAVRSAKRLASPEYFRLSVFEYRKRRTSAPVGFRITDERQNSTWTKEPDGRINWPPMPLDSSEKRVSDYLARLAHGNAFYNGSDELDARHVALLEKFLRYVQGEGVRVTIVLSPFHPRVYDAYARMTPNRLLEAESMYRGIAYRLGIPVKGSFNPRLLGIGAADLFDESHMRPEPLKRIVTN